MTDRYDSPGKRDSRALFTEVFGTKGGSVLDFFGGGRSAEEFVAAGLTVTSAEVSAELWPELERHSAEWGYEPFYGNAVKLKRRFDYINADFCNNAGTVSRKVLRRLAPFVKEWMAVTVSSDHQINYELQGASATATVPVWMVEATGGMQLEYVGRYVRNEHGQTMWIALLTPRPITRGNQMLAPMTISREVRRRGYWATPEFRKQFPELVKHRSHSQTERDRASSQAYYKAHRERYLQNSRRNYWSNRAERLEQIRAWQQANPEKYKEAQKRWRDAHKSDPEYKARQRERSRAWYEANRDRAIEQARQSRLRKTGRLGRASPD